MTAYYNEHEPYAAAWLRNLIFADLIAPGDVDERSIADVQPDDLCGYTQCHFFAGLGGWSFALRTAGWPDYRPVWTGSCPCQPFSVAGEQAGFDDPRHLWPEFARLIRDARPATVFGEQVAGASDWLRLVRGELDAMGYAVGAVPIEAASAGADHFRDRYWFVADLPGERGNGRESASEQRRRPGAEDDGDGVVASDNAVRELQPQGRVGAQREWHRDGGENGQHWPMADGDDAGRRSGQPARDVLIRHPAGWHQSDGKPSERGDSPLVNRPEFGWGEGWTKHEFRSRGFTAAVASIGDRQYVECPDGKWRRLPPPRVRWLGNGIPARVAKLRALGNAIDPRPAAQFIAAAMECLP